MNPSGEAASRVRLRRVEPPLRRALRGPCLLPTGSRLLVAVSGGADSTALLVALASLAREFGLSLHAAHLDHGLRGRDSLADARANGLKVTPRCPLFASHFERHPEEADILAVRPQRD